MQDQEQQKGPVVLVVIDGFGIAPDGEGNAITRAKKPVFDELIRTYPTMTLRASGEEVGLSWGEMGNSEVGHLNIGAGRVYYQMLPRIDKAITDGIFFENPALLKAVAHAKQHKSTLHLVGMISEGRVHSLDAHAVALLELAKTHGCKDVAIHAILDGRDTLYNSGIDFIASLEQKMKKMKVGKLASLCGRYYAMDRDNRWDRTQKAYKAMVYGQALSATDAVDAIKQSYAKEVYDEEFVPVTLTKDGEPVARLKENDAVIFFNYRPDRMRQIAHAFVSPSFEKFPHETFSNVCFVTFAEYERGLPVQVAFAPTVVQKPLAEIVSAAGLKQLHIAETEKYAHVTFFINGMSEKPFAGEERVLVPSPHVSSYDQKPEMSAYEITDRVVKALKEQAYDFYIVNFANPDMVAHTGNAQATIQAVEVTDECIGRIVKAALAKQGAVLVTSDHGNAEEMMNLRTGDRDKEHSTNPVPLLVISSSLAGKPSIAGEVPDGDLSLLPPVGMLADVAPTALVLLGVAQPPEMTGQSLL